MDSHDTSERKESGDRRQETGDRRQEAICRWRWADAEPSDAFWLALVTRAERVRLSPAKADQVE